jgi:type IV secretory pathway TrbF-like protein
MTDKLDEMAKITAMKVAIRLEITPLYWRNDKEIDGVIKQSLQAAYDLAIEKAAEICEEYLKVNHGHLSLDPHTVLKETVQEIASAINFLKTSTKKDPS